MNKEEFTKEQKEALDKKQQEYILALAHMNIMVEMLEIYSTYFFKYFTGRKKQVYNRMTQGVQSFLNEMRRGEDGKTNEDLADWSDNMAGFMLDIQNYIINEEPHFDTIIPRLKATLYKPSDETSPQVKEEA